MEEAKVFRPTRSKYLVFTSDYIIPVCISLLLVTLLYLSLYSSFFTIKTISCTLDYRDCAEPSLLAELDKLRGQNIFRLDEPQLTTRLTSGDFTIRQVELQKELPGQIFLSLQSVYPVVAIQVKGNNSWVILDQKLRVIGQRESDPNVATLVVTSAQTLVVGKAPQDELIIQALGMTRRLAEQLPSIKTITLIDPDTIELSLASGITAVLTPKKDELIQLRVLQAILADATIKKGVHFIDVRFSQPVLR